MTKEEFDSLLNDPQTQAPNTGETLTEEDYSSLIQEEPTQDYFQNRESVGDFEENTRMYSPVSPLEAPKDAGFLETARKKLWGTMWYDVPAGVVAGTGAMMSSQAGKELSSRRVIPGLPSAGALAIQRIEDPEERKYAEKEVKEMVVSMDKWARKRKGSGQLYTSNLINRLDDIRDPLDAINWATGATMNFAGQMPAFFLSGGTSIYLSEIGEVYQAGVDRIAIKNGITPEEVIEQGLDEPAIAVATGIAAGALEHVGLQMVLGNIGKNMLKRTFRQRLVGSLKSGAVEGTTEAQQSMVEQIGANLMAKDGKQWYEMESDDIIESLASGLVGGFGLGAIGGGLGYTRDKLTGETAEVAEEQPETTPEQDINAVEMETGTAEVEDIIVAEEDQSAEEIEPELIEDKVVEQATEALATEEKEAIGSIADDILGMEEAEEKPTEAQKRTSKPRSQAQKGKVPEKTKKTPESKVTKEEEVTTIPSTSLQEEEKTSTKTKSSSISAKKKEKEKELPTPPIVPPSLEKEKEKEKRVKAALDIEAGLDYTYDNSKGVKKARARKTISESDAKVLDKWLEEYKKESEKRRIARNEAMRKPKKAKGERGRPKLSEEQVAKKEAKAEADKQAKEEKKEADRIQKEKDDALIQEGIDRTQAEIDKAETYKDFQDLKGKGITAEQKKFIREKTAELKPEKELKKDRKAPDTVDDLIGDNQKKELDRYGKQSLKEARELQGIREDIRKGKFKTASQKIKKFTISKFGDSEMKLVITREHAKIKEELDTARKEQIKEWQIERKEITDRQKKADKMAEGKEKDSAIKKAESDLYKFTKKWSGSYAEAVKKTESIRDKLGAVQSNFIKLNRDKELTKKERSQKLMKVINSYIDYMNSVGEEVTPDDINNMLETGNVRGDESIAIEADSIRADILVSTAPSTKKEDSTGKKISPSKKKDDDAILSDEDFSEDITDDFDDDAEVTYMMEEGDLIVTDEEGAKRSAKDLDRSGQASGTYRVSMDANVITVEEYVNRYIKTFVKNDKLAEAIKNAIMSVYKNRGLYIVEASDIMVYNSNKNQWDWPSGLFVHGVNNDMVLVRKKKKGEKTGLHESAHLFTGIMGNPKIYNALTTGKDLGLTESQLKAVRDFVSDINKEHETAQEWWAGFTDQVQKVTKKYLEDFNLKLAGETFKIYAQNLGASDYAKIIKEAFPGIDQESVNALIYSTYDNFVKSNGFDKWSKVYGLTNPQELIAEWASNPKFQVLTTVMTQAEGTRQSGKPRISKKNSIFSRIANNVARLIYKLTGDKEFVKMFKRNQANKFNSIANILSDFEQQFYYGLHNSEKSKHESNADKKVQLSDDKNGTYLVLPLFDERLYLLEPSEEGDEVSKENLNEAEGVGKKDKIKINKFRLAKILKLLRKFKYETKEDFQKVIDQINEKVGDKSKQIPQKEVDSAWKKRRQEIRSNIQRKERAELERTKVLEKGDLALAKDRLNEYIQKNLPKFKDYNRGTLIKILKKIKAVKDPLKYNEYIDGLAEVFEDAEYREALRKGKVAIAKYKKKKEAIHLRDFKENLVKMKLNILDKEDLNDLVELLKEGDVQELKRFLEMYNVKFSKRQEQLNQLDKGILEKSKKEKKEPKEFDVSSSWTQITEKIAAVVFKIRRGEITPYSTTFIQDINTLLSVVKNRDKEYFKTEEIYRKYRKAIDSLIAFGVLTEDAGSIIIDIRARERILESNEKLKEGTIKKVGDYGDLDLRSSAQLVTFMAKFNKAIGKTMNELFFARLREADSKMHELHRAIMAEVNEFATKLGITDQMAKRIVFFSNIMTTNNDPNGDYGAWEAEIKANIEKQRKAMKSKAKAVNNKELSTMSLDEVSEENKILEAVIANITKDDRINTDILSDTENQFRDYIMGKMESLGKDFKYNTETFVGKRFKNLYNYFAMKPMGSTSKDLAGTSRSDNRDIYNIFFEKGPQNAKLSAAEAGAARARYTSVDGVYYDNDLFNIMNKYVAQSTFDSMVLPEVMVLNKILFSQDVIDSVGGKNVKILRDHIKKAVQRGRGEFEKRGRLIKFLEKAKNLYVVARMGTVWQLSTQLLTTIPAIYLHNPKGFNKAGKIIMDHIIMKKPLIIDGKPITLREWITKHGQGLQNRDVMFERFESLIDDGWLKQGYKKWSKKAENYTTYTLKRADHLAATWSFLAAYFEQGGTLKSPDRAKIAEAERQTDLLQNISNPRFSSNMFKPTNEIQRGVISFLYTFKSFAINQSLNTIRAMRHLNEADARKLVAANISNMLLYQAMLLMTIKMMGGVAGILAAPFLDDDEWESFMKKKEARDKAMNKNWVEKVATRTIFDVFGGWMPAVLEEAVQKKFYDPKIRPAVRSALGLKTKKDDRIFFGSEVDPFGGYNNLIDIPMKAWRDIDKIATGTDDEVAAAYMDLLSEAILYVQVIPFRGDISKTLRTVSGIKRQDASTNQRSGKSMWNNSATKKNKWK